MVKQYNKRHLYGGMQSRVQRQDIRSYEMELEKYGKKTDEKKSIEDVSPPEIIKTKKLKRGIFGRLSIW